MLFFDLDSERNELRYVEPHWEATHFHTLPVWWVVFFYLFIGKSYPAMRVGLG